MAHNKVDRKSVKNYLNLLSPMLEFVSVFLESAVTRQMTRPYVIIQILSSALPGLTPRPALKAGDSQGGVEKPAGDEDLQKAGN